MEVGDLAQSKWGYGRGFFIILSEPYMVGPYKLCDVMSCATSHPLRKRCSEMKIIRKSPVILSEEIFQ